MAVIADRMHSRLSGIALAAMLTLAGLGTAAHGQSSDAGVPAAADISVSVSMTDLMAYEAYLASQGLTPAPLAPPPRVPVVNNGLVPEDSLAAPLKAEEIPAVPPAPLPPTPPLATNFEALPDAGAVMPPDTNGAAGPNHLMVTLNDRVRMQDKNGNVLSTVGLGTFWSPTGAADVFDPKVVYDSISNRFIVVTCANRRSGGSAMVLAVSASSDPTGTWYMYKFDADAANVNWADYPNIGVNSKWITFTCNMFTVSGDAFAGVSIWAVDKSSVLSGGAAVSTLFFKTGIGSVVAPCLTYSSAEQTHYLVNVVNGNLGGKGYLRLHTITGTASAPVYTATSTYPTGVAWSGSFQNAPQLGTTNKIATNDDRMLNAVLRNGRIWCTLTGMLPYNAPNHTGAVWFEINPTTGATVQSGYVHDASGQMWYHFPSIAVNKDDEVLLGFSGSSSSSYASTYYTFRDSATPAGAMQDIMPIKAGVAAYSGSRWGDYSATCVDPANDTDMWTIQEYASASNRWGTWWAKVGDSVDTTPPHLSSAQTVSSTTVRVTFNEAMTNDAALTTASNYTFTGSVALTCTQATRVDSSTVDLTVNEMTGGANYTVTVRSSAPAPSDVAGNILDAGFASAAFSGTGAAPTASVTLLDGNPTSANSVRFGVNFNEPVGSTFTAADVTATGSLATGAGITVSGGDPNYTVTVTPASSSADGTLGITIGTGIADAANNSYAGGASPSSYTIDNTPPDVAIGSPSATVASGGPVTYTIGYTGASAVSLIGANVTLNKTGTANGSVSVSGTGTSSRTVTISSITGDGTLGISLASGTAVDAAGNSALAAGPGVAFTVDNTAPTIALSGPSASSAASGPITYTVTYGGATSISLSAGMITLNKTGSANGLVAVSGTGTTRTVTVSSITGDGTLGISIAAGSAADNAGNNAPGSGASTTFTVDNTVPAVAISAPSAGTTKNGPITYTITYTGASSVSLTAGNITLNRTGSANGTVAVSGSGTAARTVTISSITGDGTLGISLAPGTAVDAVGNSAGAAGPSATVTADNTGPSVVIGAPSSSLTRSGPITYTVTYTGASAVTLNGSHVTLNTSGTATADIGVSGSGTATRTVTLSNISGDGTVGISVAGATATDSVGNAAGTAGPSAVCTVDNTAPTAVISEPSATLTRNGPITYTIVYTGANNVTLGASDITLNRTGTANGSVSVTGSGTSTRTVTISSITGDGTIGISLAGGSATDSAGNATAPSGSSSVFTVDNTAPSAALSAPSATITRNGPVTYTVLYGGASSISLVKDNVTLNATGTATAEISVSGTGTESRTITLTDVAGAGTLGISLVAGTARDAAGNLTAPVGPSGTFSVDQAELSIGLGAPSTNLTQGGPVTYEVTYQNAATVNLSAEHVSLNATGTASGTVAVSGTGNTTRTITVSNIAGNGTLGVSIAAGSAVDAFGVQAPSAGPSSTFSVDNAVPTGSITLVGSSPTNANSVSFNVNFSENVAPTFSASDVTVTGSLAGGSSFSVSGAGASYTVTVTPGNPSADGTLAITIGNQVTDPAGNAFAGGSSPTFTIDNTAPALSIGAPSAAQTRTGPVTYALTYSGADTITVGAQHITLNKTGTANAAVSVTGSGNTRTVTLSSITGNGTLGISVAAGTASDAAGNLSAGAGPSTTCTVDNTPPTLAIGSPSPSATKDGPVTYSVVYTGASTITLTAGNIALNKTGTADGTVAVSGTGSTRTVTVSNTTGEGTLGISIAAGTASDAVGNTAAGAGPSTAFSVDHTPPSTVISAPSIAKTKSGPVTFTVTYGGATSITLSPANVTLNTTGTATGTVAISGSGSVSRTVTISNVTGDGTIGISIAAGTAADAVGNAAPAAGPSATFEADNSGPPIAIGAPPAKTKGGPVSFTVTYTGAQSITLSDADISLVKTGTANATFAVAGTGAETRTVTLSGITGDGTLAVALAAGTAVDDVGNLSAAFGPSGAVTVDNTGPTVAIGAPSASAVNGGSVDYAVTYTGASSISLMAPHVTLNKTGTANGSVVVSGSGTSARTVSITGITGSGTLGISLAANSATDDVGNAALAAGPSTTVDVDSTPPSVTVSGPSASVVRTGPVDFTVTYTGATAITLSPADVTLNATGSAVGTVSVSGTGDTRTVRVDNTSGDGTLSVSIAAGTASDTAGNLAGPAGPSPVFSVDNTAPTVAISAPSAVVSDGAPVTYTLTYQGASSISLTPGDITLTKGGTADGVVSVSGTGSATRTVTISSVTGDGSLRIAVAAGTAVDAAGNISGGAGPSQTVVVDNTPPAVAIGAPSASVTKDGPVTYMVQYTGAYSVSLTAAQVTLNTTGTATGSVSVSGAGASARTVTIDGITGAGTLGISIAADTAIDSVGNRAPSAGPSATFSVDQSAVSVSIGAPSASLTRTGPVTYAVMYGNASSITLGLGDITLNKTGTADGTVSLSGSGDTRTVTLSELAGTGTLSISIAAGTATDGLGDPAPAAGPSAAVSVHNHPPTPSISLLDATPTNADSVRFKVEYDELVSDTFTADDVTVTGSLAAGAGVSVSGTDPSFIVTVTPSDPDADGTIGIATGTEVFDLAGNAALTGASPEDYSLDNGPPSAVIGAPSLTITNAGPVEYTIAYSDAADITLAVGDVTLVKTGTANGTLSVTGNGATRTVTVSNTTGNGDLAISVAPGTATDSVGNPAPALPESQSFVVDNAVPAVSVGAPSQTYANAGPVTFTVTYAGADAVDLQVADIRLAKAGTANATVSVGGSGNTRTVTLSDLTGDGSLSVEVLPGTASDVAGNTDVGSGGSAPVIVDNTAPGIAVSGPSEPVTHNSPVSYTVSYTGASAVTLTPADVTLNTTGTATGTVSVSGSGTSSRTVTVSGIAGDGTMGISIAAGTAHDEAGNLAAPAGPSDTFLARSAVIAVGIGEPSTARTQRGPVNFTIVYENAQSITLAPQDVIVNGTGTVSALPLISGTGTTTRTVTLTNITGDGTVSISLAADTARDLFGEAAPAAGPSGTVIVDNTAPGAVIALPQSSPSNADAVEFDVTFSEPVGDTFAAQDVTVTGSLSQGATVGVVANDPRYTVIVSPASPNADGTLGIALGTGIADLAGNVFAGATSPTNYTLDNTPPGVSISAPSVGVANSGPVTYTVSYSGATTVSLNSGGINLHKTGTANAALTVSGTGATRTVTLSSLTGDGTLSISVAGATAVDAAGNVSLVAGPSPAVTVDNTGPSVSISAPSSALTLSGPVTYTVTYGGAQTVTLSAANVSLVTTGTVTADAAVSGSGFSRTVTLTNVAGDGTLAISITPGTAVDSAGNLAPASGVSAPSRVDPNTIAVNLDPPSVEATQHGPVVFVVNYENAKEVSLGLNDITLNTTGTATGTMALSGDGLLQRVVTVSDITGDGEMSISIAANTAVDFSDRPASPAGPSAACTVDNTAPVIVLSEPSVDATTHGPVTYTVTYIGAENITLSAGDIELFSLQPPDVAYTLKRLVHRHDPTPGTTEGTVSVSGTGNVQRTIVVSNISGDGLTRVIIHEGTATDAAGNVALLSSPSTGFLVDNTAPEVIINQQDTQVDPATSLPIVFDVYFSEEVTGFDEAGIDMGGTAANVAYSVFGTGAQYQVVVDGAAQDGTLTPTVKAGGAADSVGNANLASTSTDNSVTYVNVAASQPVLGIARNQSTGDVTLSWNAEPQIAYEVYAKDSFTGNYSQVASLVAQGSTLDWTDPAVFAERYYQVRVESVTSVNVAGVYALAIAEGNTLVGLPLNPADRSVSAVFGDQVPGAPVEANATRVAVWDGAHFATAWYKKDTGAATGQWMVGASPSTLEIPADQGVNMTIPAGSGSQTVFIAGTVSTTARMLALKPGMNLVAPAYPLSRPLGDRNSGAQDANLWESGTPGAANEGQSTRFWNWNGSRWEMAWLVDGLTGGLVGENGQWLQGNASTDIEIVPGKGYWVQVRPGTAPFTWTYPLPDLKKK